MGFGLMSSVANAFIDFGRKTGRTFGYELAVVASDHSLNVRMVNPRNHNDRAWDPDLYRYGNLFVSGYANPVKLKVDYHQELENPNQIEVDGGTTTATAEDASREGQDGDGVHADVISSPRYREYMRQDLISQVLNPQEQWKKLLYAIAGVGVLSALTLMFTLSSAGFI